MSETKHTPGPWTNGVMVGVSGAHKAGLDLAFITSPLESRRAECEANARLIAAAPDLLESLQLAVEYLAEWHSELPEHVGDNEPGVMAKFHAVIAAATGATP